MRGKRKRGNADSPPASLDALVQRALDVTRTALRNAQSLTGDNFYANKLVELRADATNIFRQLSSQSAGDSSALAELIELVFDPTTRSQDRLNAAREISFSLRTMWTKTSSKRSDAEEGLFPLTILSKANRGYMVTVGRQMNGCYSAGWYDACAVMMRRLIEIAIIEAFEGKGISSKIQDAAGDYFQLTDLVARTLSETAWRLSRNAKKYLPTLRDVGHMSAHGRYYTAKKEDIDFVRQGCRAVVEELLHHANLL